MRKGFCLLALSLLALTQADGGLIQLSGVRGSGSTSAGYIASYTTTFPLTENPISEGGAWRHLGANETVVRTTGGHAVGTMTGGSFDDSNAYLPGFAPSHEIDCTVYKSTGFPAADHEVELLLSWRDDATPYSTDYGTTTVTGYELNISYSGQYFNLGRFKREALVSLSSGPTPTPANGDHFRARIVRNGNGTADISFWWNDVPLSGSPYHDTTPEPEGFPGIGFFIDSGGNNSLFGFADCTATSL